MQRFILMHLLCYATGIWLQSVGFHVSKPRKFFTFRKPDMTRALRRMPPLLRSYLMMGGWVSDHAVVDVQMNTLHVFTGIEIRSIPATRKRLLRALS